MFRTVRWKKIQLDMPLLGSLETLYGLLRGMDAVVVRIWTWMENWTLLRLPSGPTMNSACGGILVLPEIVQSDGLPEPCNGAGSGSPV